MRVLTSNEVHHINGGTVYSDLVSFTQQGFTHQEKTCGIVAVGAGLALGAVLPAWMSAISAVGAIAGWVAYDKYYI
jgi:hypothetical protein